MDKIEYKTIDRAALGWPAGEWDGEPDKVQWQDDKTGLACLAKRHGRQGHWCGYVGVPPTHRLFGKGYSEADADVHGGLTYADACDGGAEDVGICHKPAEGEPDHVWWFGFDCAHSGDHGPMDEARSKEGGIWSMSGHSRYRTLAYVQSQCASLAQQLAA